MAVQAPPVADPAALAERERKTVEFLKKNAVGNMPEMQFDLGVRYMEGRGADRDYNESLHWFRMAGTNGHKQVAAKIAQVHELMVAQKNRRENLTQADHELVQSLKAELEALRIENQSLRRMLAQPAPLTQAPTFTPVTAPFQSVHPAATLSHWITSSSSKRHNSNCRFYKTSTGRPCAANEGTACKVCGGYLHSTNLPLWRQALIQTNSRELPMA